jgi:hypothetical protein
MTSVPDWAAKPGMAIPDGGERKSKKVKIVARNTDANLEYMAKPLKMRKWLFYLRLRNLVIFNKKGNMFK